MLDANWVIAIATIVYTGGTFLLWWTTRNNVKSMQQTFELTRDAFKLHFLTALYQMEREAAQGTRFIPERWHVDLDTLKRVFPSEFASLEQQTKP